MLAGCGPFAAVSAGSQVAEKVDLDDFDTLEVNMSSYDLTVSLGSEYRIEYTAEEGREPKIEQKGGKLTVKQPSKFGSWFGFGIKPDGQYTITVPEDGKFSFDIRSSSGDITLDRVNATGKIKASSGEVMLNDVEGDLIEVETSSGEIDCDKIKAGAVSFGASSGDIELLRIFADDISAETSSGDIELNNSTGKSVMCESSSGKIEIQLNGDPDGYSYYVDTSSGDAKVNGEKVKKEYVKDDGKDGKVAVRTSSGDIEIEVSE